MTKHFLDPLLKPESIALVGASTRKGSPGSVLAELVIDSSFQGRVYPVNPGYQSILETSCYQNLEALPETVDHVVLAVSNEGIESALAAAISHGARAVTIYASCVLKEDTEPPLKQRLQNMAKDAGIAICGGNCMGFYSIYQGLYAGMYPMPGEMPDGSISFIAQSGSAFSALAHNGCRLRFNLCVSSGNELTTTVDQYMDWSLEQNETRVIALFLETIRNPKGFVSALEKARTRDIPVVVLKVGKSPLAAAMANTHTGAIVGNHAAYQAVFEKYGVIEVSGFDQMAATLMLFQSNRQIGPGKLATIQESGGLMELVTDLCHQLNIEFADISEATKSEISRHLDPGLEAANPLDAWSSNDDFENRFYYCISAMMKDHAVAAGIFFTHFRDGYYLSEAFFRIMQRVSHETGKPIAMANCYSDIAHTRLCKKTTDAGIPFIDGALEALTAIQHVFNYRDHATNLIEPTGVEFDPNLLCRWKEKLSTSSGSALGEAEAMALLEDFSIAVPRQDIASSQNQALSIAETIGYPVVLKTAELGINHKSDQQGVVVNITNSTDLSNHYQDFFHRLGPDILISKQISPGTEIGLGMINDSQFGPLIMLSAGGIFIELMADRAVALAPVTCNKVDQMLNSLKINNLIQGIRGQAAVDRKSLIKMVVQFSHMADALGHQIKEIDINPVIVNQQGATAVDALIITQ